jgi:protein gp37
MADGTKIEWTDETWNPIVGCVIVSRGCTNCYAMKVAGARLDGNPATPHYAGTTAKSKAGPVWTGKVAQASQATLLKPLTWKKPRRVFVNSMGDLFAENVPTNWIDQVFAIMALAPQHQFQVLTKRPERMRDYVADPNGPRRVARVCIDLFLDQKVKATNDWPVQSVGDIDDPEDVRIKWPLPNAWLGVSVEDQATADARIPHLLSTPAAIRWISAEPLLGPVDLTALSLNRPDGIFPTGLPHEVNALHGISAVDGISTSCPTLDWVVVGGESGPGARPMHPDWARSLRDQCAAAGVPYFFKQWGKWVHECSDIDGNIFDWGNAEERGILHYWSDDGTSSIPVAKALDPKTLDGITHDAWPEVAG